MMRGKSFNVILGFVLMVCILGGAGCASAPDKAPAQVTASAFTGRIDGDWEIIQENALAGQLKGKVVFVQNGDLLTVTLSRPKGGDSVCEGKVDGNKIEWVIARPTRQGGVSNLIYGGLIKDANTMEGFYQIENGERVPWRAKRIVK